MIGEEGTGFETAMRTLDHTRVTIAAQAVGVAQGAVDYALSYAKERQQFGKPIADFQGLQFLLADMGMKVEAARQLTYAAAGRSERNDKDLTFFGAAAKCFASDVAMEVTTNAVQVLGGYGYTRDYPVERMMRDAKITQIYEGTNQVQRIVMARQLLVRDPVRAALTSRCTWWSTWHTGASERLTEQAHEVRRVAGDDDVEPLATGRVAGDGAVALTGADHDVVDVAGAGRCARRDRAGRTG